MAPEIANPAPSFKPNKTRYPAIIAVQNPIVGWTWGGMPWTTTQSL